MIRKLDADGNPVVDEDGQTILTEELDEEGLNGEVHAKGVIEFPPFVPEQRPNFSDININGIEGEDLIQKRMRERPVTLAQDIGQEILITEANEDQINEMPDDEKILFFMRSFDEMVQMDANVQLADSISFYKITKDAKIDVVVDSVFNVGIAKPLFVASLVCYDSGYCYFDGVKIMADIHGQSPVTMQKYDDNYFQLKFAEKVDYERETSRATSVAHSQLIEPAELDPDDKPNKIIFVVFRADYADDELQVDQIGFTILPLMYQEGIIHGQFQLPLFSEITDLESYTFMAQEDPWKLMDLFTKKIDGSQAKIVDSKCPINYLKTYLTPFSKFSSSCLSRFTFWSLQ